MANYVYKVNVTRRLKNQSYTDRANRAARDRARRETKAAGGDWEHVKDVRANDGGSWIAYETFIARRNELAERYANGEDIGNAGYELRDEMLEAGFDIDDTRYHFHVGTAAHGR